MTVTRSWPNAIMLLIMQYFSCSGGSVMQYLPHQSITDAPDAPTTLPPPATPSTQLPDFLGSFPVL